MGYHEEMERIAKWLQTHPVPETYPELRQMLRETHLTETRVSGTLMAIGAMVMVIIHHDETD